MVTPRHALPSAYARAARRSTDARYLQFSQLGKTYATAKGPLTVVRDFDLSMRAASSSRSSATPAAASPPCSPWPPASTRSPRASIVLDGRHVEGADPERAVVFQSPNLMPWLTARENVAIGADRVYPKATRAERQEVVEYYLEKVGLGDAMDRLAAEMSNGMRQRVGIARAFALSPKLLLLDEPFGMLDSLTRWELQEVLMEVWSQTRVTAICVTHDVDEAILLSDRVVMMTNGPEATIGRIVEVDLPRPRTRKALVEHPDYYRYRAAVLGSSRSTSTAPSPRRKSPDGLRRSQAEARGHRRRHGLGPRPRAPVRSRPRRLRGHALQRRAARQLQPPDALAGALRREDLRRDRHPRRRLVRREQRRDPLRRDGDEDRPRPPRRRHQGRRDPLRQAADRHRLDALHPAAARARTSRA